MKSRYYLSKLDEIRFGIRTAKADNISQGLVPDLLEFCYKNKVELLIARCSTQQIQTIHILEQEGFNLMDTLVYYIFNIERTSIQLSIKDILIRPFKQGEEIQIKFVAEHAFKDYFGHYHADPRLDKKKCDEVYVSWAYRSCIEEDVADEVLVAIHDNSIVGFVTLKMKTPYEGECIHGGVMPDLQGKGIYQSFIIRALEWCKVKGANKMIVSTQINNIAVQKVWSRLGFEFDHAEYTFHKWFV